MPSGYNVLWTDHAIEELRATILYLELNFPEFVLSRLSAEIERVVSLISSNPFLFAESLSHRGVRKAVILTHNTMFYQVDMHKRNILILSFFSNRQSPDKLDGV